MKRGGSSVTRRTRRKFEQRIIKLQEKYNRDKELNGSRSKLVDGIAEGILKEGKTGHDMGVE